MTRDRKIIENNGVPEYATYADLPSASNYKGLALVQSDYALYKSDGAGWIKQSANPVIGRIIRNLLTAQYISNMTFSAIAGTGTPTGTFNDADNSINITLAEGLTGRGYLSFPTISFAAQRVYMIAFEVTGTFRNGTGTNMLANGSALTVDWGSTVVSNATVTGTGKYACIFSPTTTQNNAFRLGFGVASASTAPSGGLDITIKNPMCLDITDAGIEIPPPYILPLTSANLIADYQGSLTAQTSGKFTLTTNTPYSRRLNKSVAMFGDSYSNDATDYPASFRDNNPDFGAWYQFEISKGVTASGTTPEVFLASLQSKMQTLIDLGYAPGFIFMQSSLNTLNNKSTPALQDASIALAIAALETNALWCISAGIQPIFSDIAPFATGAGADWNNYALYHAIMRYNTALFALAAKYNIPVLKMRKILEDPAKPYYMLAAYDSGDGIHPNATGMTAIATGLKTLILQMTDS